MKPKAKAKATVSIDALLQQAGWHVCDVAGANIHASVGVAIREFPVNPGFGFANRLMHVNGQGWGVIEAKKEDATFSGFEVQSGRYSQVLPITLPPRQRLLPVAVGIDVH